jgi:histidine ammonia-lyase
MNQPVLVLDGTALTRAEVAAVARGLADVAISAQGRDRASAAASVVRRVSARSAGHCPE